MSNCLELDGRFGSDLVLSRVHSVVPRWSSR